MLQKYLSEFLSQAESKIFVFLLGKEASASEISKALQLNRTFVYEKLNSLIAKGFISEVRIEGKRKFKTNDPVKILETIRQEIEKKKEKVEKAIEEAKKFKAEQKTEGYAELFFGKRSIFYLLTKLIEEKPKEVYMQGSIKKFKQIMEHYYESFELRRKRAKIKLKALVDEPIKGAEIEILEEEQNTLSLFYNDKAIIILLTTPTLAILIKSKEFVKSNIALINKFFEEEVRVYRTKEGIEHAYLKLLEKRNDEIVSFGYFGKQYRKVYTDEFAHRFQKEAKKKGIKILTIGIEEEPPTLEMRERVSKYKVIKFIGLLPKIISGPIAFMISSKYILQILYAIKEPRVLLIKNKETVKIYREHFNQLSKLKELKKV